MIRLKNNVLPVWIQWDGDEDYFERAKETIIEDIKLNGFDHYTGFADITAEPTKSERNWDGAPAKVKPEPKAKKDFTSSKGSVKSTKNVGLPDGNIEETAKTTQKTAS